MNKSFIIYDGPSLIDGKPIVAIAQIGTNNRKTGDSMVQTWILRSDIDPISASRTGEDSSICGDCIHRGKPSDKNKGWAIGRSCYVNLLFAPNSIYKAYKRGSYPVAQGHDAIRAIGLGMGVRLGSYGDPLAVPEYIWRSLTSAAEYVTAYTHGANKMPDIVMTSADSVKEAQIAWDKPIPERTFRVISSIDKLIKGKEILCPASEEAKEISGKAVTCAACKLCGGNSVKAKSIAIVAHGAAKKTTKTLVE